MKKKKVVAPVLPPPRAYNKSEEDLLPVSFRLPESVVAKLNALAIKSRGTKTAVIVSLIERAAR